jgi:hypothetical protein
MRAVLICGIKTHESHGIADTWSDPSEQHSFVVVEN